MLGTTGTIKFVCIFHLRGNKRGVTGIHVRRDSSNYAHLFWSFFLARASCREVTRLATRVTSWFRVDTLTTAFALLVALLATIVTLAPEAVRWTLGSSAVRGKSIGCKSNQLPDIIGERAEHTDLTSYMLG